MAKYRIDIVLELDLYIVHQIEADEDTKKEIAEQVKKDVWEKLKIDLDDYYWEDQLMKCEVAEIAKED